MDNTSDGDKAKYQLCNILHINNRAICLLCMEDIGINMDMFRHNDSLISGNETVSSHLQSEAHMMKLKSLFRKCFADCLENNFCQDDNYSDVISSLVFDLSLYLGNEPSYISQIGFNVVCLMCSKNLFEACTDKRSVDIMLFNHLQSEQHITSMKNWACWIYFFSGNVGFVIISQSRVYCSFCKQTITVFGNTLLTALDIHLDNEHNLHLLQRSGKYVEISNDNDLNNHPERSADATTKYGHVESKLDHHPLRSPDDAKENVQLENECDQYPQRSSEDEKENYLEKEHGHCRRGSPENGSESGDFGNEHDHYTSRGPEDTYENSCLENYYDHYPLGGLENVKKNDLPENENDDQSLESGNDAREKDLKKKLDHNSLGSTEDNGHPENESGSRSDAGDAKSNDSDMGERVIYSFQVHSDNSSGSPSVRENYGSEFDSEPTDTEDFDDALEVLDEDYDDALEILTCTICGGFVEIINEDAEFSLRLHCQKHKDLKSINTDDELPFNSNVEYVCPICHDVIPLFNKNIELSVQRHFEERKIDHEGLGYANNYDVKPDLFANTCSNFPESLKKYQSFLLIEENTIFCKLCNCVVPLEGSNISKILHDHLSNSFHEEQYKTLRQDLAMVVLDYNKQYQSDQPSEQSDLFETLVKKHPLIKENRQFIERRSVHYFCQICQKHINHSLNEHNLALNFMFHLRGPLHTKSLKDMEKNTSEKCLVPRAKKDKETLKQLKHKMTTTMFWASNKSAEVHMNQNYFKIKMGTGSYHCVICNESIEFSRSGSKLISHCNSPAHNEILTRNASVFVSNLCSLPRPKNYTEKLGNILDSLASCEYLKPHIEFIFGDEKGCRCVVCDVKVPSCENIIQEHLLGNNHKDNAFKVINQIQLEVKKKRKPAKVKNPKELVKKALASLLQYSPLVGMNSQFIDVKNEHFFCKVCCETIKYSNSGKHLKTHLNSVNHKKSMNR